jgi:hypothetical protein
VNNHPRILSECQPGIRGLSYEDAMGKKSLVLLFSLFLLLIISVLTAAGAGMKPLPPLMVSILPSREEVKSENIRPGDAVDLLISVKSAFDAPEIRISIKLSGGVELISGETGWSGPMAKNQEQLLRVTVRAPLQGTGRVKARAVLARTNTGSLRAESAYSLGPRQKTPKKKEPSEKKDSSGRSILEYRVD